jgi:hypothetical protein
VKTARGIEFKEQLI